MKYAKILNAAEEDESNIVARKSYDNFDAEAVSHKFGPTHEFRIVPVVRLDPEVVEDTVADKLGPLVTTIEATRVTEQRTVIPFTDEERIARIKQEANERIIAIADEIKQRNLIAHSVEMEKAYRLGETPTAEQLAIAEAAEAIWAEIKAIRDHSNAMEADFSLTWDDLNG